MTNDKALAEPYSCRVWGAPYDCARRNGVRRGARPRARLGQGQLYAAQKVVDFCCVFRSAFWADGFVQYVKRVVPQRRI